MVRAPPPEDLIVSEIFKCNDCGAGTEKFLYHENDESYRYYDPNTEDRDRGVERLMDEETVECRNCGSTDVEPKHYEG